MLQIRRHTLGQATLNPLYAATAPPVHPIDPSVYAELRAAGEVLRLNDPGAPQTVELVKRIIEAQGFPSFGGTPSPVPGQPGRISDLNPLLDKVAYASENPYIVLAAVVGVPLFAFLLGRSSAKK